MAEESRKLKEEAKLKSKAQKNQEVRHTPDFILLKYSYFLVDTFANDPYAWLVFDLIWFCFVLGIFFVGGVCSCCKQIKTARKRATSSAGENSEN